MYKGILILILILLFLIGFLLDLNKVELKPIPEVPITIVEPVPLIEPEPVKETVVKLEPNIPTLEVKPEKAQPVRKKLFRRRQ